MTIPSRRAPRRTHAPGADEPQGSRSVALMTAHVPDIAELARYNLQDLLGVAPAGIGLLSGPEQRWVYVNDHYVRMTGRSSSADFIGKTMRESLPEIETLGFHELRDKVYRTGTPYIGREMKATLHRSAAGLSEEGYFDFVYQPVRDPAGNVEGILIHVVEVTDRVAARKRIEQTAERLELAQVAARIGTWEWDPDDDIHELSPELHRIFGTAESDPSHAQQWASRVDPEDWPRIQQLMLEGHRLGKLEFEYRYQHPARGLRWLYCIGSRLQGQTRMFGIVQDITERKAAEEASHRLAAIVESSDDAIVSKDLNGIVTSWNPGAQRIFGYTPAEMIGRPILTIIPPELHATESEILATIARGERIEHFETVRLNKDGERIDVSLTVSPVKDETGRIVGAAKIARNITELRKAERALRTTERLASVGRLAATVAHEINNPLEAVTNLVYLAKTAADPGEVRAWLDAAEQELARVSHLTRQTLGFYRETKSASSVRPGDLVTSLLPVFASRTRSRGIELCPEIESEAEICAVPGEMRQVIANLISNSIDALTTGGKVRIRVSAATLWGPDPKRGVRLTVADTGCGIPPEARPRIFEPFFTTKRDVGTGLGLWVCKSIVETHGGSIRVRSQATPGRSWTVFSAFLPSIPQNFVAGDELRPAV